MTTIQSLNALTQQEIQEMSTEQKQQTFEQVKSLLGVTIAHKVSGDALASFNDLRTIRRVLIHLRNYSPKGTEFRNEIEGCRRLLQETIQSHELYEQGEQTHIALHDEISQLRDLGQQVRDICREMEAGEERHQKLQPIFNEISDRKQVAAELANTMEAVDAKLNKLENFQHTSRALRRYRKYIQGENSREKKRQQNGKERLAA